jgi:hypothetical protein
VKGILHLKKLGGILHLLVNVRSFPFLKNGHKNPPPLMLHDLHMFRFMITFVSCFTMNKAH